MKHVIPFILFLISSTSVFAQDIQLEGSILFNHGSARGIIVEDTPSGSGGSGFSLSIAAGNSFFTSPGDTGGNLFLRSGQSSIFGLPGSVYISNGQGNTSAIFHPSGIEFLKSTYIKQVLELSSAINVGDAYNQLEFQNPNDDTYAWILGPQSDTPTLTDNDFFFHVRRNNNTHMAGWIQDGNTGVRMNFTGQHRSLIKGIDFSDPTLNEEDLSGMIVVADQNEYMSMSGGLTVGQDAIMIDESLPVLSLSSQAKDKRVFGVISGLEADSRNDAFGAFVTPYEKEVGDQRFFVNSIGEGGIWIIDQEGDLTSGDYIITSNIPGYGMRQESEFLANYTVAKITMDCTFEPEEVPKKKIKKQEVIIEEQVTYENVLDDMGRLSWEQACDKEGNPIYESAYRMRYLLPNGDQISKREYNHKKSKGEEVFRAAFVGCTYHCG